MEENSFYLSPSAYVSMKIRCQAKYMAEKNGVWKFERTVPMLVGSYVDKHFYGGLEEFKLTTPELFTQKGELRAEFKNHAIPIIESLEKDKFFMGYIKSKNGKHQYKVEGEIGGVPYLGFIDEYIVDVAIVDLKIVMSIRKRQYNEKFRCYENFIESSGYIDTMAIYRELIKQETNKELECFIAAASKEDGVDKAVIRLPKHRLDEAIQEVAENSQHYFDIRTGKIEPERCENCAYCRSTKVLTSTIEMDEI